MKSKFTALLFVFIIALSACGRKNTVQTHNSSSSIDSGGEPTERIAVLDFKNDGIPQDKSRKISELIRTEIINTRKYIVIERSQINMVFKEHGFGNIGATDSKNAIKVGKMLAAQKIMIGTVMKLGDTTVITGRVVDVEKGIAEVGARVTADDDSALLGSVTNFVQKITGREVDSGSSTIAVKSKARLKTAKQIYKQGEDIIVSFKNFPGTKYDYISLAKKDSPASNHYTYQYTRSATKGSVTFSRGVYGPGSYEARAHTNYSKGDINFTAKYSFTVKN